MRTGCLLALSLSSLVCGCAPSGLGDEGDDAVGQTAQSILGGQRTTFADRRGTVAVVDAASGFGFCTGTLVAPDVVITAAHCVYIFDPDTGIATGVRPPEALVVVAGETSIGQASGEDAYAIADVTPHPQYLQGEIEDDELVFGGAHDIAVLSLKRDVERMLPVAVLSPEQARDWLAPGGDLVIEGYGTTDSGGTIGAGVLREASVPLVRVGRDEFIAGEAGTADTCPGDSGGPVYLERDGMLAVVGVTSRGLATATRPCGEGGIYTLVPAHLDFLAETSPSPIVPLTGAPPVDPGGDDDEDDSADDRDEEDDDGAGVLPGTPSAGDPDTTTSTDSVSAPGTTRGGCTSYPFATPFSGPGAAMALGLMAFVLRRRA